MKKLRIKYDFLGKSKFFILGSFLLCVFSIFLIWKNGFKYGVDFAGGIQMHVKFSSPVSPETLRGSLNIKSTVQSFGNDLEYLLRLEAIKPSEGGHKTQNDYIESLIGSLKNNFSKQNIQILKVDSVGSQIGEELKKNSLLAIFYCLLIILIYIGLRFDYTYSPPAVFCLFHDTLLTLGIFSLLGKEVNVQTLAAILTIIGYSLNDTIVTFDRIRENIEIYKGVRFFDIVNHSLNDVLSRTILTSLTTLMAIASMYFVAEGVIKDFAFTLGIGVFIGTYSSIYIASPLLLILEKIGQQKS